MKKKVFSICIVLIGLNLVAQTPRMSLYEEFTGETCPPCATANPPLNLLLASPTNTPKIVAIKWQVPIPSAPSNTWSLYQTNKVEIDWRWKSVANGGYGYIPAINSAPSGKIDGEAPTVFGAASAHPANLNNNVISTAQSFTSAFSISVSRAWDASCSSINLTVSIAATANFTAVGALKFRTVMVENIIDFPTAPGSNGEKHFEDVAIKSFPTLQSGISMASNWIVGQTQTFTLNCPIPSYTRKKEEIAFVGFIQDDGNQRVAQAVRVQKSVLSNDAIALSAKVAATCSSTISPIISVYNNGLNAITALTITPYIDGAIAPTTSWNGNIAPATSATVSLNTISSPTNTGAHTFSYNISAMNGTDGNMTNNSTKVSYLVASDFQGSPVSEDFALTNFPPVKWAAVNSNSGPSWTRVTNAGGYNLSTQSTRYDFFNNKVIGDMDELFITPMNLSGTAAPVLSFDYAYAQRDANSNDKLEVMVSNNCGSSWTNVYSSSGYTLATALPMPMAYLPDVNDISQWQTVTINLTGYNSPSVLVKFVVTNDNGNNLYIDNVNLNQTQPVGLIKETKLSNQVSIFPNPTSGNATLRVFSLSSGKSKLILINTMGQIVSSKTIDLFSGNNNILIDTKEFSNGIYSVVLETATETVVKKISISK
jgi:hypothetical protein